MNDTPTPPAADLPLDLYVSGEGYAALDEPDPAAMPDLSAALQRVAVLRAQHGMVNFRVVHRDTADLLCKGTTHCSPSADAYERARGRPTTTA